MNNPSEQGIFLIFAIVLLGILLWMTYTSKQAKFATMFVISIFTLLAFYLFQFGSLGSFSLKALSAEAKFIKERKVEVQRDAKEISGIKLHIEQLLADSQTSQKEIEKTKNRIIMLEEELAKTAAMAKPPTLSLSNSQITRTKSGYNANLQFVPSKNQPLGSILFIAAVIDNSEAQISDFWPSIKGGGL